jgi:hypothetical protein
LWHRHTGRKNMAKISNGERRWKDKEVLLLNVKHNGRKLTGITGNYRIQKLKKNTKIKVSKKMKRLYLQR